MAQPSLPIVLITGAGGMGTAIAQRLGATGKHILLADFSPQTLETASTQLWARGLEAVSTFSLDVSSSSSIAALAGYVSSLGGNLETVIHTAGLGPFQASAERIYQVNLLGTALMIDTFLPLIGKGGSMVCIASIAGYMLPEALSLSEEKELATLPSDQLLSFSRIDFEKDNTTKAYQLSKRGVILRARAAAASATKGVRVNTISPGAIDTPMLRHEMGEEAGEYFQSVVDASPAGRMGTAEEIAEVVAFLTGPGASFIWGSDLVVDGGTLAKLGEGLKVEVWE